jgi:hypothetical protein
LKCEVEINTEGILKSTATCKTDKILNNQTGINMSNLPIKMAQILMCIYIYINFKIREIQEIFYTSKEGLLFF